MSQRKAKEKEFATIFAVLSTGRAVDFVQTVQKARRSESRLARLLPKATGYLLGDLSLGFERPASKEEERVLRVETEHPLRAEIALRLLPGVRFAVSSRQKFRNHDNGPKGEKPGTVLVMLDKTSGVELIDEITRPGRSENTVVRRILGDDLGHVSLATDRPVDEAHARVVKVETTNPVRTRNALRDTPGVAFAVLVPAG